MADCFENGAERDTFPKANRAAAVAHVNCRQGMRFAPGRTRRTRHPPPATLERRRSCMPGCRRVPMTAEDGTYEACCQIAAPECAVRVPHFPLPGGLENGGGGGAKPGRGLSERRGPGGGVEKTASEGEGGQIVWGACC
jgi:hypothetical protein